jgi:hypothetical protein
MECVANGGAFSSRFSTICDANVRNTQSGVDAAALQRPGAAPAFSAGVRIVFEI